jgi:NADH-quinone oxidoreductase subunit L
MGRLALIAALPLLGFLVNGVVGPRLPKPVVATIGCVLPALGFALTLERFAAMPADGGGLTETLYTWVGIPGFAVDVSLYFDAITAVMCLVVTGIGTLIHIYSVGYMAEDRSFARYFAYLNLFLFFMLVLVLGKNLVMLFIGWEGVGLASYLLIGFWFEDPEKTAAGVKAFVVNRVGDTGFVLAAFLIYSVVGSLDFQAINAFYRVNPGVEHVTTMIGLLLLLGACGKSAQIPLHVWLPDAMAGPTPVSALIHAATMVTAGVYLLARLSGLYLATPAAMNVVAWIGAATALLGATMGVTQFNLKKVLAYSTISQIGFMVLACGVGAFTVGLFHLVTHAFFKACLFLGAGAVLHALQGEEDMRRMGALARRLPFSFATFLIATLALCGIPPFAGFFSKDEILANAWSSADGFPWLWLAGLGASALTAFYMFRAIWLTFFGASRVPVELAGGVHEPPPSMSSVLAVLAAGSLLVGFIGLPAIWQHVLGLHAPFYEFLAPVLPASAMHLEARTEWLLMAAAVLVALGGILLAWLLYGRAPERVVEAARPGALYALVNRGYFFDSVYYGVVVRFMDWLSESVLGRGIETALADVTLAKPADGARRASRWLARMQTGNVQTYAFYVVVGLALTLWWAATHD